MPLVSGSYNEIFLTEQDLKDNSIIENNVDPKTLYPVLKLVQDKYLQEILGTELLVALQTAASANSLDVNQQFLLTAYIKPVLVWYTILEGSFYNSYKFSNKGLERMNSQNSVPATLTEIDAMAAKAKDNAEFYGQRLIDYLYVHQNDFFPQYNQNQVSNADMFPKRDTVYQSGLFLGNLYDNRDNNYRRYDRDRDFYR